ncbi:hypothetical protein GTA08_BOTSDO09437 [Neofusicoccum parvum]|nr:hypothetical protein GTA08_BOTSDO09437 [Neofusicoccum parvum]
MDNSSQGLYQWELQAHGEHHCGVCHKPLANKKNSQRICVGYHVVPCAKFHNNLFMVGREVDCKPCRNSSEEHWKRHKEIAEALRALHNHLGTPAHDEPSASPQPAPAHPPPDGTATATATTKLPRRKDLKAEKKLHRALNRPAAAAAALTSSAIAAVGRAMHPAAPDLNGGLLDLDDPHFLANLVWCGPDAYVVAPSAHALRRLLLRADRSGGAPRAVPDFAAEKARVLRELGAGPDSAGRGRKARDLLARVMRLVQKDFEAVWREERETARRRGGFLRYMSRKTLMRILEMKQERRERLGADEAENTEEGPEEGAEEEDEVEDEADEWGGWDYKLWMPDGPYGRDGLQEDEPDMPADHDALHEEPLSPEASTPVPDYVENPQHTLQDPTEEPPEERDLRPTLDELLTAKDMPSAFGIVPGCQCGFCFERSKLAEMFLGPFISAAKSGNAPEDKPLARKRVCKKPTRDTRKVLSTALDTSWTLPNLSYYLHPSPPPPPRTPSPTDPVRLLTPIGRTVLATAPLPRATASAILSARPSWHPFPTGAVALAVDAPLADYLLRGRGAAPADVESQMRGAAAAGWLAEQVWQFHVAAALNRAKAALRERLGEGGLAPEEEWGLARRLAEGVERVCWCRGVRTERVVECACAGCEVGVFHARCVGVATKGAAGERWFCEACLDRVRGEVVVGRARSGDPFLDGFSGMVIAELFQHGELVWSGQDFGDFFAEGKRFDRLLERAAEMERQARDEALRGPDAAWPRKYRELSEEVRGKLEREYQAPDGWQLWKPQDDKVRREASPASSSTTRSDVSTASTATGYWAVSEDEDEKEDTMTNGPGAAIRLQATREKWNEKAAPYLGSPYL